MHSVPLPVGATWRPYSPDAADVPVFAVVFTDGDAQCYAVDVWGVPHALGRASNEGRLYLPDPL